MGVRGNPGLFRQARIIMIDVVHQYQRKGFVWYALTDILIEIKRSSVHTALSSNPYFGIHVAMQDFLHRPKGQMARSKGILKIAGQITLVLLDWHSQIFPAMIVHTHPSSFGCLQPTPISLAACPSRYAMINSEESFNHRSNRAPLSPACHPQPIFAYIAFVL